MTERKRARDWGIAIGRYPTGMYNAITDVAGVRVGHETIIEGGDANGFGRGVARTGVTVILPNEDIYNQRVFGGCSVINGAGEVTGFIQVQEWGMIETPIALTGSMNVGLVSDGIVEYMVSKYPDMASQGDVILPIVGECNDGVLSDPRGRYVKQSHVLSAIQNAAGGPVAEGAVGGGTGMMAFQLKAGIGTSSRIVLDGEYTVGALVMSNFGLRRDLRIDGVPVGRTLVDWIPPSYAEGSIIIVIATDAPLFPHQLNRLARRAALAMGRIGSHAHHGSGEIVLSFSTAQTFPQDNAEAIMNRTSPAAYQALSMLKDDALNPLFEATIDCVEEAILNSLFMAETMSGRTGTVHAIPSDVVMELIRQKGFQTP